MMMIYFIIALFLVFAVRSFLQILHTPTTLSGPMLHLNLKLGPLGNYDWRRGSLMVSAFDSGSSGPGSSPGRGHRVVFMGKTLNSHSASLQPGA